jgi:hypothetical protein
LREVAGWDPNGNDKADEFDLCTSCHTYYNQDGVLTATGFDGTEEFYHATSWYRTIPSTHYDDPDTGYGKAESRIEGYVIRENSENPCFDCHGHELRTNTRYANAPVAGDPTKDLTIHTQWAQSGHAGGLLKAKLAKYADLATNGVDGSLTHPTELDHYGNPAKWSSSAEGASMVMKAGADDTTSNGGFTHYDWDAGNRQGCQVCHTSTGFVNYVTDPENYDAANNDFSHLSGWANVDGTVTPSGQNEMLYCWGCHNSAESGELRVSGAVTTSYDVVLPDAGSSNTCNVCHAGRGNNVTVSTSSRFAGHHAPAAATLYSELTHVGGEFVGLSYGNKAYFAHATLGADGAGPCVTCHMDSANHEYAVVAKDEAGVITDISATVCVGCHDGEHALFVSSKQIGEVLPLWNETLGATEERAVTQDDVDVAAAELEHEAHSYQQAGQLLVDLLANTVPNYKEAVINHSSALDNDRRAFQNSKLAGEEKGGFAHNRYYVKRLIFDSIDWADNGVLDGTIGDYSLAYPDGAAWLGATRP